MVSALDISTSALVAQRTRLNVISGNIANMGTLKNEAGENEPYKARYVEFMTDQDISTSDGAIGVKVSEIQTVEEDPIIRHQPNHPLADENGNVAYPNVDLHTEMVDALLATRAYEANVGIIEISKGMGRETLEILA
ncbi:MAG: flagellar basal body rod protein FlgC [Pirellulaceae bacterium]|nr:flagellar basal body rod protein FlgC [Pirellulaceae bacterium]